LTIENWDNQKFHHIEWLNNLNIFSYRVFGLAQIMLLKHEVLEKEVILKSFWLWVMVTMPVSVKG
jgi:hypothetical protein